MIDDERGPCGGADASRASTLFQRMKGTLEVELN